MRHKHNLRWARIAGLCWTLALLTAALVLAGPALAEGEEPQTGEQASASIIFLDIDDIRPPADRYFRPPNLGLQEYTVSQGDTLSGLAAAFGLKEETILLANPTLRNNPAALQVGLTLTILPLDGIVHTVVAGDTLTRISRRYAVSVSDIYHCFYNNLSDPHSLQIGDRLLIPGGSRPIQQPAQARYRGNLPADAPSGSGTLIWPIRGTISQGFKPGHPAIDISANRGTPILTVDDGFVISSISGTSGYGNFVIVDHGNGMQTLYAHLEDFRVHAGQPVTQGQPIGSVGRTGWATGYHLHLEIILNGVKRNPLDFLP